MVRHQGVNGQYSGLEVESADAMNNLQKSAFTLLDYHKTRFYLVSYNQD